MANELKTRTYPFYRVNTVDSQRSQDISSYGTAKFDPNIPVSVQQGLRQNVM